MIRRRRLVGLVLGVAATLGTGALLFALRPRTRYVYPTEYPGSTLVLQVLDEHGPVAGRELEVEVASRSSGYGSGGVSDENGILRVPVGKSVTDRGLVDMGFLPDWQEAPADITVRVSDERSFGHLERAGTLPAGEVDVGAVLLQPKPLLAEGRVIDDDGKPVVGARCIPWTRRPVRVAWSRSREIGSAKHSSSSPAPAVSSCSWARRKR